MSSFVDELGVGERGQCAGDDALVPAGQLCDADHAETARLPGLGAASASRSSRSRGQPGGVSAAVRALGDVHQPSPKLSYSQRNC